MNEQMNPLANPKIGDSELPYLTLGEWVARYPNSARIFENRGIDFCCGGKQTLEEVCTQNGLDAQALRSELAEAVNEAPQRKDLNWRAASLTSLIDHIVSVHHEYVRIEKPRLMALAEKVARVHGGRHPELVDLACVVTAIFEELDVHMEKEELEFFAACRKWEKAGFGSAVDPNLKNALHGLEDEHLLVGQMLQTIRQLTSGFTLPEDACNSYRALYKGLQDLEVDLHAHIHKENNILHIRMVKALVEKA